MTPEQTRAFFIECLQDQVKILQKRNAELERGLCCDACGTELTSSSAITPTPEQIRAAQKIIAAKLGYEESSAKAWMIADAVLKGVLGIGDTAKYQEQYLRDNATVTPEQIEAAEIAVHNLRIDHVAFRDSRKNVIEKIVKVALTAAAGVDSAKEIERLTTALRVREKEIERLWDVEAATIDQCAQVADHYGDKLIAARILALKDKP